VSRVLMPVCTLALLGLGLAGCDPDDCQGDACDTDTDLGDTDATADTDTTDSGGPQGTSGEVRLEIDIEVLPTDIRILLLCNDRPLVDETRVTAPGTKIWSFPVSPGEACEVRLEDERGGRLPAGRLYNCSVEAASWESQRGFEATVASLEVEGCRPGCIDPLAENYNPGANLADDSCDYLYGCTDEDALNYDPVATANDGSCDFGGFGRVDVYVHTDASPADTSIRLECDGFDALTLASLTQSWSTETTSTNVDAGFDCEVFVADAAGDVGPAGRVEVCGQTMLSWDPLPAQDQPWEASVGIIKTTACSGCTDPLATNFDDDAFVDDGTCTY